jgi:hypothetical protein
MADYRDTPECVFCPLQTDKITARSGCDYGMLHTWLEVPPQAQIWAWVPEPP